MLLGLFKISGHSMLPNLKPGDRVIVSSIPYLFSTPKVRDVVMFKNNGKMLIKRIEKFEKREIIVSGDNKSDSLKTEPIKRNEIQGKVIFTF